MPLSATARRQVQAQDPIREPHEPESWLPNWKPLTELECREMAAGRVPEWLREACRAMVEWTLETGPLEYVGRREQQQRKVKAR
jgi:hypothetical protein